MSSRHSTITSSVLIEGWYPHAELHSGGFLCLSSFSNILLKCHWSCIQSFDQVGCRTIFPADPRPSSFVKPHVHQQLSLGHTVYHNRSSSSPAVRLFFSYLLHQFYFPSYAVQLIIASSLRRTFFFFYQTHSTVKSFNPQQSTRGRRLQLKSGGRRPRMCGI